MAGHSQWANRKHRKARQDAKRGKLFSRLGREIMIAAREGGGDPDANARLRMAIERARQASLPADNIERAIKRGTGELEGQSFEELMYEGYGPGGAALLIQIVTDNRNRTASEVRHLFSKHGGNLSEKGSVAWMFERKGLLYVERSEVTMDEEELMLASIEAGAEDFRSNDEGFEIITSVDDLESVRTELEEAGVNKFSTVELTQLPVNQVAVDGKEAEQLLRLLDALEDHDDVQSLYSNFDISEELLAAFSE